MEEVSGASPNKVKTPGSPSGFRPISLLNFLSKALEYIVHQQINAHIEKYQILDCMQTGFKKNNSTQTALIKLTDHIRVGINRKHVTLLLLFDFSKAFDTVCHVSLLRKLENFGFSQPAFRWIASYLSGRQQAVKGNNGSTASFRLLNTGVPQGSVLDHYSSHCTLMASAAALILEYPVYCMLTTFRDMLSAI